jgi:predicted peptidase
MRAFPLLLLALTNLLGGCTGSREVPMTQGKNHPAVYTGRVTFEVATRYLLYLPEGYAAETKEWPLLLFLHGAGERGKEIDSVKKHGPPKLIEEGRTYPFIVVSPQCPPDEYWSPIVLRALLDEIISRYRVDRTRVYLTGLSMGGNGTWKLATAYPEMFAAIAPICGWGDTTTVARLKNIPAWVFHGAKDKVVTVDKSEAMVRALKECGGDVRLTVYPEAGHDSWSETYANPELYEWLLTHRLPGKP